MKKNLLSIFSFRLLDRLFLNVPNALHDGHFRNSECFLTRILKFINDIYLKKEILSVQLLKVIKILYFYCLFFEIFLSFPLCWNRDNSNYNNCNNTRNSYLH